ncbi:hypothetical protein [Sphaerobacter thermophilus]|jgi:hypothetical protein|uniref:YggT family protein n=1 Tax=Sphaerobacter thermophilus (strain ATCC 49802 / DSM 20745 / KCCM 41009 / NCIMB 13125 / S 6022) TaxID=479434 RepID=D1C822_SPHTD|nr:hypothetical protein [Sphaerobacter thermophilus]ACZ39965.1 hypothetical protein Sthe_2550 [Sphaerobacter thermophilus DSM 20745]
MADYERERRVREERRVEETSPVDPPGEYRRRVEHEVVHERDPAQEVLRRRAIFQRIATVVWTIIGFIEALIGLRVLLKLIAANPDNAFVNGVYDFSGVFVNPFLGIVNDPQSGNSVLEINSLIAMVVYLLIGWGLVRLIWLIFYTTEPTEA